MQPIIALQSNAKPVCEPIKRRWTREEEVERQAMQSLIKLRVLEPSRSPWATDDVFEGKKSGHIRESFDFRWLKDLTIKELYPMETC